jgi:diaminohydroxyphosphoribosylaminopyrimidine deaminase/5-amino-6-(5-phosphoribosylamino)uracil reductase
MTATFSDFDHQCMQLALNEAEQALFLTSPNPRVGCVIAHKEGRILAQAHTQAVGGLHAEAMALKKIKEQGLDARGATAYVTLEPCSHTGRTPPCAHALIQSGIARVVACMQDPNPLVSGRGFEMLRNASIQVDVGLMHEQAYALNEGFIKRMTRALPFVRLKIASSLDGATALLNGQSQWITGALARQDGHAWRARSCAVMSAIGTVRADNPRLNVREISTPRQPKAVIVDARLETPTNAALFDEARDVLIYCCAHAEPSRKDMLEAKGATVIEATDRANPARVDLSLVLRDLAAREINELHVEAGAALSGSLIRAGWVDEYLIYQAPIITGPGKGWANTHALEELSQSTRVRIVETQLKGEDLFIRARAIQ